jgi:hypothetical protein
VGGAKLLINLTPLIPLSILGEGEEILERGEKPLSDSPAFGGI